MNNRLLQIINRLELSPKDKKDLAYYIDKYNANITEVTYVELVALRDNGELISGMQYRITDYVTTTVQENTRSAGHQFDVIVTADNENTLNEIARACLHNGDTYFTEAGANLAAWQIWYCLDNDAERFAWADAENGKGVIYRMIDEWNNDIPYDFKNTLFVDVKKSKINAEANYYGNWWAGELVRDGSMDIQTGSHSFRYGWVLTNVSGPGSNGVWYTDSDYIESVDTIFYEYDGSNFYESETIRITNLALGQMQYTFGNALSPDSELSDFVDYSIYRNNCYDNIIKPLFSDKSKQELNTILFGPHCHSNTFGHNCYSNTFGDNCYFNHFGDDCFSNSFGNRCGNNTFGTNCNTNSFGDECRANTFSNGCNSNSFGYRCNSNSFGITCYHNSLNTECYYNSFGNYCGNVDLSKPTNYQTFSINSNGVVKAFNFADLADLLN